MLLVYPATLLQHKEDIMIILVFTQCLCSTFNYFFDYRHTSDEFAPAFYILCFHICKKTLYSQFVSIFMSKYDGFSDRELIALLQKNDEGALRAIYDIHIRQLHYFVLKTAKSRELAEDIVQDVFIKVWDNRLHIDPTLPFKPYLYTLAKRHLLNLLKRIQHESGIIEEIRKYTSAIENTTDLELDFEESNMLINEAISKLPAQCRTVFLKCKIQGLSYRQAAEELGITEGTVNSQMVKALKNIRAYINLRNSIGVLLICLSKY